MFSSVWFEYYNIPRTDENETLLFKILDVDVTLQVSLIQFAKFSNGFLLNIGQEDDLNKIKYITQQDWFQVKIF